MCLRLSDRLKSHPTGSPATARSVGTITRFDVKGDAYVMLAIGDGKELMDNPMYPIKTLNVEGYKFVRIRFPNAVNIGKNKSEGEYITIELFDDDVFKILAQIPDQPPCWHCDQKYERMQ